MFNRLAKNQGFKNSFKENGIYRGKEEKINETELGLPFKIGNILII